MVRTENKRELIHSDISEKIIGCCFEVMKELGSGFLEKVYKNALFLAMKQKGLNVLTEQTFEITFIPNMFQNLVSDCAGIFIFATVCIDHVRAHGLLRRLQV